MRWRFDAIEDEAVFQAMRARRPRASDLKVPRLRFYRNYAPRRELYIAAADVCFRHGWDLPDNVMGAGGCVELH